MENTEIKLTILLVGDGTATQLQQQKWPGVTELQIAHMLVPS